MSKLASSTLDSAIPPMHSYLKWAEAPVAVRAECHDAEADDVAVALRRTAMVCPALLVAVGLMVLVGWCLGNAMLTSVMRGHVSMKANTALGFLVAGLAMAAHLAAERGAGRWNPVTMRRWGWGLALVPFSLGVLSLAEYFLPIHLHIDQLLFLDRTQLVYPGRMATLSAINFCLGSLSLLTFGGGRARRQVSRVIALVVALDAFAAIVGYLYGVEMFYGAIGRNSMALHTGATFVILGLGTVLLDSKSALMCQLCTKQSGGVLLRRSLPFAILLPVALGWLYQLPAVNFGRPRFGMALFAVTLVCAGTTAMWATAIFLERAERQREEMTQVKEQSAAAVRESERELRLVTDQLPTVLSYIDTSGRFVRVNRTCELWLGRPADEIVGRSMRELLGEGFWERSTDARERVLRGHTVMFETTYPTVNGERHAEITYAPDMEDSGEVRGIACMVLDVQQRWEAKIAAKQSAELEKLNASLQLLAVTDQLTGLTNRGALEWRMRSAFAYAKRYGRQLSLLMLDIDNFKVRNDTWGHAAGDDVLRRLGAILRANVRTPDVAARYGGEEFSVLLLESNQTSAKLVAERIREVLAEEMWSEGKVTLSIGVASLADDITEADELFRRADAALYAAKRTGKDKVCVATTGSAAIAGTARMAG